MTGDIGITMGNNGSVFGSYS